MFAIAIPGAGLVTAVQAASSRFKSSSVFLGVLYLLAFVFTLPYAASVAGWAGVGGSAVFGLAAVLAVVLVQALLNWLYLAIVALPALAAAVLVIAGWGIWLYAPIVALPLNIGSQIGMGLVSGGTLTNAADSDITLLIEIATRLGQTLIALGGVLWWVTQRIGKVNYIALGAYLASIALLGSIAGVTGLGGTFVFLVLWLALYMKVKGDTQIPDLRRLFQVVATVATIIGTQGMVVLQTLAPAQTSIFGVVSPYAGSMPFANVYHDVLLLPLLAIVWWPQGAWRLLSEPVQGRIAAVFGSAIEWIRLPLPKA